MIPSPLPRAGAPLAALLLLAAAARAGEPAPGDDGTGQDADQEKAALEARVEQLEQDKVELFRRIDVLAEGQEGLTLGSLVPPIGDSYSGLGPAASKTYGIESGFSIGGYGEGLYTNPAGSGDEFDALRTVFYFGYKFDEHWVFNSEIEVEHAGTGGGGSVSAEFAYIDYLHSDAVNFRTGLVLVPMGFLNELHEPTTFLSANRPETEQRIIPSTWRENGVGVHGSLGGVDYRAYVVNGLDATGFSASGLRGGRQKGSEALADDLAFVVRADYTDTPGLVVGGSYYCGDSGQEQAGVPDVQTKIWEAHAEYRSGGLFVRGLAAMAELDDVAALNASFMTPLVGTASIGEELEGGYVEVGYDVMTALDPESEWAVTPFARFEAIDTQAAVPAGFASDPANDRELTTFGVNVQPIDQLVFKLDFVDSDTGDDAWNYSVGYVF